MTKRGTRLYETWKQTIQFMIGLGIGVAFFFIDRQHFIEVITAGTLQAWLVLGLAIVTVIWFLIFSFVMLGELELLNEILGAAHAPRPGPGTFVRISALGIAFGILLASTTRPILYTGIASILELLFIIQDTYLIRSVFKMIRNDILSKGSAGPGVEVIYDYYLEKQILLRGISIFVLFIVSFILSILEFAFHTGWLMQSSYVIMIATIVIGEISIWRWRQERERGIDAIKSQRD